MELVLSALFIFFLRVVDVTLGTLRIMMVMRGRRRWAGLLGFFESLVWVLAAGQVFSDLDKPLNLVGYAAGFAAGTVLGGTVERWLALGTSLVRVVAPVDSPPAYRALQEAGYPTTVINGEGRDGPVRVVFSIVKRKEVRAMLDLIQEVNPDAVVTVEETRLAELGTSRRAAAVRK